MYFLFLDQMFIRQENIGRFVQWKNDIERYFSVAIVESQMNEGLTLTLLRITSDSGCMKIK